MIMIRKLEKQFGIHEKHEVGLKDICKSFNLNLETPKIDDALKGVLKSFLSEIYKNHTETIDLINKIDSYVTVSDYYKQITERAKIMEKFLREYGWIFIAAGITDENEMNQRKETMAKFCERE